MPFLTTSLLNQPTSPTAWRSLAEFCGISATGNNPASVEHFLQIRLVLVIVLATSNNSSKSKSKSNINSKSDGHSNKQST